MAGAASSDAAVDDSPAVVAPTGDPLAVDAPVDASLTERELAILTFERRGWRHAGAKEEGIRAEFSVSAARYYQLLGVLIDSPLALVHDPMLIKRLHRLREARLEARALRSLTPTESPLSLL